METRQVILQLRTAKGLSQEELAEKSVCYPPGRVPLGKTAKPCPTPKL